MEKKGEENSSKKNGYLKVVIPSALVATLLIGVATFFLTGTTDKSRIDFEVDPYRNSNVIFNDSICNAYSSINEDESFKVEISLKDINNILNLSLSDVAKDSSWNNKVNKLEVKGEGNSYIFSGECSSSRRVYLYSSREVTDNEMTYHIDKAKLSHLNYQSFFPNTYKKYINDDILSSLFDYSSLSVTPNMNDESITYKVDDFIEDIRGENIFSYILSECDFIFDSSSFLSARGDASTLLNESKMNKDKYVTYDISGINRVITGICKTYPTLNNKERETLMYFLQGSKKTNNEFLDIISEIDLSFFEIPDARNYDGLYPYIDIEIESEVYDESVANLNDFLFTHEISSLKEESLSTLFSSSLLPGRSEILKDSNGEFIFLSVGSTSIDIFNDKIIVYSSLSLNGMNSPLYIELNASNNKGYIFNLDIGDIYLGTRKVNERIKEYIIDILKESLKEYSYIDISSSNVTFDFTNMIHEDFKDLLDAYDLEVDISLIKEENSPGRLLINAK